MKNRIQVLFLGLTALSFVGCNDFNARGTMLVHSELKIKNHHIQNKTVSYAPGAYDLDVNYNPSNERVTLTVLGHDHVKFKLLKGYLQEGDHQFHVSAKELGEDFDIQGSIETQVTHGQPYQYQETCVLYNVENRVQYGTRLCTVDSAVEVRELKLKLLQTDTKNGIADLSVSNSQAHSTTQGCESCHL
jgi:hypothetical protein